jgi:hypothetical protein
MDFLTSKYLAEITACQDAVRALCHEEPATALAFQPSFTSCKRQRLQPLPHQAQQPLATSSSAALQPAWLCAMYFMAFAQSHTPPTDASLIPTGCDRAAFLAARLKHFHALFMRTFGSSSCSLPGYSDERMLAAIDSACCFLEHHQLHEPANRNK